MRRILSDTHTNDFLIRSPGGREKVASHSQRSETDITQGGRFTTLKILSRHESRCNMQIITAECSSWLFYTNLHAQIDTREWKQMGWFVFLFSVIMKPTDSCS